MRSATTTQASERGERPAGEKATLRTRRWGSKGGITWSDCGNSIQFNSIQFNPIQSNSLRCHPAWWWFGRPKDKRRSVMMALPKGATSLHHHHPPHSIDALLFFPIITVYDFIVTFIIDRLSFFLPHVVLLYPSRFLIWRKDDWICLFELVRNITIIPSEEF